MDLNELNQLDLNNIGDWPLPIKVAAVLLGCALIWGATYYLDTKQQLLDLKQVEAEEPRLRAEFEKKQERAANLDAYKQQIEEMRESFGAMLRQLPNRTEVAALLVDVSQTGLANGLEFERFEPQGENNKDFYAELPIRVRVNGTYHDFGRFVSGLAALPRIVTVHDIKIAEPGGKGEGKPDVRLSLDAIVKTYRYLEEGGAP